VFKSILFGRMHIFSDFSYFKKKSCRHKVIKHNFELQHIRHHNIVAVLSRLLLSTAE